jgi:hypothetical protein
MSDAEARVQAGLTALDDDIIGSRVYERWNRIARLKKVREDIAIRAIRLHHLDSMAGVIALAQALEEEAFAAVADTSDQ